MNKDALSRMEAALDRQLLDALENGVVAMKGGEPIIVQGKDGPEPLMIPPSAAILNVARQRLAGAGADVQTKPSDLEDRMKAMRERMANQGAQLPATSTDPDEGI